MAVAAVWVPCMRVMKRPWTWTWQNNWSGLVGASGRGQSLTSTARTIRPSAARGGQGCRGKESAQAAGFQPAVVDRVVHRPAVMPAVRPRA